VSVHYWEVARLRFRPDASPPLRPASDASSFCFENALFSAGTPLPPLLAISRCRSGEIDANPRFNFGRFEDASATAPSYNNKGNGAPMVAFRGDDLRRIPRVCQGAG
jgi:hypothetical protein